MNKMKIRLNTLEDVQDFVDICSNYISDINVYDEKMVLDGKSILGVSMIPRDKELLVQMISPDETELVSFINEITKYKV